jgi:phenylacetate-coenzyme A ligase PaaK-like adenylate-forming protein
MNYFKSFKEEILYSNKISFEEKALRLFYFQAEHNPIYKAYNQARGVNVNEVNELEKIPFLPIQFFKNKQVFSGNELEYEGYFSSSGTTGMVTSKHYFWSMEFYLQHALKLFEETYSDISDFHILALLPSYLERKGSSLVSMADYFIRKSSSSFSGFFLYNHQELVEKLNQLQHDSRKVLLLGVTFALLDLAESGLPFPKMSNLTVMETGGMKGRRKEMIREEVHNKLKKAFHQESIHSEYGMTELMSQAYSKGDGKYNLPDTMCVILRDIHDPYAQASKKQGGLNLIDLANFHSCAFIETQDLGKWNDDGSLEILGRIDNSELRGCNLMVN